MSTPTPKGPDAPTWTRRGDDSTKSWGREREPGAAFRGISRGRGRGGAVRGRPAGRGAGGRNVSARGVPDAMSTPPPLPEKPGTGGSAVAKNSAPPKGREVPKVPSSPNLTVDSQISQSADSLSPPSPNKPIRRRRNTYKRSASATVPKPIPSALTDGLPTSPSTPLMPSMKDTKDPSLPIDKSVDPNARVHDLRQDITSLVEHVRSMAMDNKRPNSPSTHIDWAGEDDDSLPDLDDWGVSSKLTSDVGETVTKTESKPPPAVEPPPISVPVTVAKKEEGKEQIVAQVIAVDGTQSSAESPTESSMSLSVPPPAKRVRERKRGGSRRDKEKRLTPATQPNGSKEAHVPPSTAPKKSLLERISSPVHTEPPALPNESKSVPSVPDQTISGSISEPNLPRRTSLPPKPSTLPNKPSLPSKDSVSWKRNNKQSGSSPRKGSTLPAANTGPVVRTKVNEEPVVNPEKASDVPPPAEQKEDTGAATNKCSFDWSDERLSSDTPVEPPIVTSIKIKPPAPPSSVATLPPPTASSSLSPNNADAKSDVSASPRFRSHRPLSGEVTPRPRRERSPYKTHNPRNYSAPQAGPSPSPSGRARPQHASRPIICKDALAMISRSLRESPSPRRSSPPVTKAVE